MVTESVYEGALELSGFEVSYNRTKLTIADGTLDGKSIKGGEVGVKPHPEHPVQVRGFVVDRGAGPQIVVDRSELDGTAPDPVPGRILAKLVRLTIPPGTSNDPNGWSGEIQSVKAPEEVKAEA